MLQSLKELSGYTIRAADGDVGKVHEFYFDDRRWTVRYLVANIGGWLIGRRVLLSTTCLRWPDREKQEFPITLAQEQVENSPPISADKPVSRQMEKDLLKYYGWRPCWNGMGALIAMPIATKEEKATKDADPHLRSTREVIGYHIQTNDGEIGHVEDFIASSENWSIRYMVVDKRNWLPGKKALVAPTWVERVDWAKKKVHINLSKETIENSPEFDPSAPVNREYELRLYDYYGRPRYWTRV